MAAARSAPASSTRAPGPMAGAASSNHIIWGRPEVTRKGEGSSSSFTSSVLNGVQVKEVSGQSWADLSESDSECVQSWQSRGKPSNRGRSSQDLGNDEPTLARETTTYSNLSLDDRSRRGAGVQISRAEQSFGDMGCEMDSDADYFEAPGDVRPLPVQQGQQGGTSCYDREAHDAGRCKPCSYFVKKAGCKGRDSCTFCHLPHEARSRPSKQKRDKCKMLAEAEGPDTVKGVADKESLQGNYMRSIIASRKKLSPEQLA